MWSFSGTTFIDITFIQDSNSVCQRKGHSHFHSKYIDVVRRTNTTKMYCWRVELTTVGMVTGCCQGCGLDFYPVTKPSKGLRVVRVDIVQSSGTMQARLFNDQKCGQVCKKGIRNKERRHLATEKPKLDKAQTLTIRVTYIRWIHTSATLSGCSTKTITSCVNRHHVVHRMRISHTQNFRK